MASTTGRGQPLLGGDAAGQSERFLLAKIQLDHLHEVWVADEEADLEAGFHALVTKPLDIRVEACQAAGVGALTFGDAVDPASPVSALLRGHDLARRKPSLGTSPHVFYIL